MLRKTNFRESGRTQPSISVRLCAVRCVVVCRLARFCGRSPGHDSLSRCPIVLKVFREHTTIIVQKWPSDSATEIVVKGEGILARFVFGVRFGGVSLVKRLKCLRQEFMRFETNPSIVYPKSLDGTTNVTYMCGAIQVFCGPT